MYVTTTEANNFLGTSWEDALIDELIKYAEAIVNSYCYVDNFSLHDIEDEEHNYNSNWPYYLKHSVINSISEVNKEVFSWKYRLQGRKLTFWPLENINYYDEDWYNILFTYNVWFETADMPKNIKLATLFVLSFIYNKRKSAWVKSFTIWDLSATFDWDEKQLNKFKTYLSSYVVTNVVWCK